MYSHGLLSNRRRHLDGTALAALAAADAIDAAWQHAAQHEPDVDGLLTPSVAAGIRAWSLAAVADPASLPGSDAALTAVLDALPDVRVSLACLLVSLVCLLCQWVCCCNWIGRAVALTLTSARCVGNTSLVPPNWHV